MALFKKKKPKKASPKKKKERKSIFKNEKFKFILGVLVLILTTYLFVAFISFLFYGAADQSKLDLKWSELILNSKIKVDNKAGKTGAYLAELIINQGFGIASFIFIFLLTVIGLRILGRKRRNLFNTIIFSFLSLIWLSVTLGLIFKNPEPGASVYWGGHYGFMLSLWLSSLIGVIGLVLLLFLTGLMLVIVRFEKSYSVINSLFTSKPREKVEKEEVVEDPEGILFDDSISKVIEDDDVVKAVFDPDDDDDKFDDELELETVKDEEFSGNSATEEDEEDIKLTVKEKVDEEEADETGQEEMEDYDPTLDLSDFKLPTLDLLEDHKSGNAEVTN